MKEKTCSMFAVNLFVALFSIVFGILLEVATALTVTDMTPGIFGASPKHMPYLVGVMLFIGGLALLANTWTKRSFFLAHEITLFRQGEILGVLKYVLVICAIILLVPRIGFYSSIVAGLIAIMLISGVRNILIILSSSIGIILIIRFLLQELSGTRLPRGIFI